MSFERLVEFAQRRFLPNLDANEQPDLPIDTREALPLPSDVPWDTWRREPLPDWLREDHPTIEVAPDDIVVVEGATDDSRPRPSAPSTPPTTDVLAYYLPYHFYRPDCWGIYVRLAGVARLAEGLKGGRLRVGDSSVLEAAFSILYEHELFHCSAETACTRAEAIVGANVYSNFFAARSVPALEEPLCNAHALRALKPPKSAHARAAETWMRTQPYPYCNVHHFLGDGGFGAGKDALGQRVVEVTPAGLAPGNDAPRSFLFRRPARGLVPTRMVLEAGVSDLRVVRQFPAFDGIRVEVHTNDHRPAHIHLQLPVNRDRGSFEWGSFAPLGSTRPLSNPEERRLRVYLRRYGKKIEVKLRAVYEPLGERVIALAP